MSARTHKPKVVVAMSGGVDSSVAAALLKAEGYEVIGCFMRLGRPGEPLDDGEACEVDGDAGAVPRARIGKQGCCSINDARDARHVAARLGIPLYVLNFKDAFGKVIDYFTAEYHAGRTPNPCVRCNDWLKFGRLTEYARSLDAAYVASGHYARLEYVNGEPALYRGVDHDKDQSYVLFGARRASLGHTLFPVGRYDKAEIRRIAAAHQLPVHDKPDSQEICFVPSGDYLSVIGEQSMRRGLILDESGRTVGEHEGHQRFTIGQRRGLGVALGYAVYVVDKDARANTVTVGRRQALAAGGLVADQANWLAAEPLAQVMRCTVKIRYNAAPVPATVRRDAAGELVVWFDDPQHAVAPGQAVVCYDGERVLGGGWIRRSLAPSSPRTAPPSARCRAE
jgi:tRNA-specific 2-thiouridylase